MKKFLTTILAVVYLTTSVGATIHFHYCMDRLVSLSLNKNKSNKKSCPYCGMGKSTTDKHCGKESKGCCKDDYKQIKIEKDQKAAKSFQTMQVFSVVLLDPFYKIGAIDLPSVTEENPLNHAPPRSGGIAVYIRNCVFRI